MAAKASGPREPEASSASAPGLKQEDPARRKDSRQIHRVRHGVLSREVLAALTELGEDPKTYRRLERQFRIALRPPAPWGNFFFDRFWACYLRLMLIGRLETKLFSAKPTRNGAATLPLSLMPGKQPMLVLPECDSQRSEDVSLLAQLPTELLAQLNLAQRYDRHYAREMYRSLALLLLLRRGGEAALEGWAAEIAGAVRTTPQD